MAKNGTAVEDSIRRVNDMLGGAVASIGFAYEDCERVPSTSHTLNYMTHGGLPRGSIVEFFGPESSGKTTTAIDFAKNMSDILRKEGGNKKVVYIDLEQSLTEERCRVMGLDPKETVIIKPTALVSAEKVLNAALTMYKDGVVGCMVIDSIPTLATDDEISKDLDKEPTRGGIAKVMTRFLKEVIPLVANSRSLLILVNQVRDSMDPYKPFVTPGGRAIKFYSFVRLQFMPGHYLNEAGAEISGNSDVAWGMLIKVRVVKSKGFPPDRLLGQFPFMFYTGIDAAGDLGSLLLATRTLSQSGAWFAFVNEDGTMMECDDGKPARAQGFAKACSLLRDNPKLREACLVKIK